MAENDGIHRAIIDRDSLPAKWPTHRHAPEFWEQLGRTVATFGFLEEVLGKAIFAYTATRRYETQAKAQAAYAAWLPTLERALTETLKPLADAYGKAVRDNSENTTENVGKLIVAIKEASEIRNVICHGSWRTPDAEGRSLPLFINKRKEIFETPIDIAYLHQVHCHVAELACTVVDTVTHMGFQFPGGAGPGKRVWNNE
ncbi:hypothetical protein SAMN05443999_11076 [Roseovarius azorensis]|uniref:Uncharacterized protein n=1 Tax=Roseovarius azorensis TaxID=1287727 RepID=A0A1H7UFS4_9RHOB|nr:hypothetical protein [Roseovarius azorensis]SEL95873.1 hypothetical protein SAMN05443999_11076 [Roseovarius azorensis]